MWKLSRTSPSMLKENTVSLEIFELPVTVNALELPPRNCKDGSLFASSKNSNGVGFVII